MAHIYIYSPSSTVRDKTAFRRGVQRLSKLGHSVEVDEAALAKHMRFAGDDSTRIAAIHRAAASGADIAMISRGGYGLTRILPEIKLKTIAKSIEQGTRWVGLSDFCALQSAVLAQTGAVTWAGPSICDDFDSRYAGAAAATTEPDDIMQDCFEDLVQGRGEGSGWRMPLDRRRAVITTRNAAPNHAATQNTSIKNTVKNSVKANSAEIKNTKIQNGTIKNATKNIAACAISTGSTSQFTAKNATLWGGNLCVLTALLGTPYLKPIDKGVLFFEDVGEHPYRIERMLTTWLHAGILQKQKAIVFGQFTGYQLFKGYDSGYTMDTVVERLRSLIKVPIFTGLPFGHVPTKVCLPVGAQVSLHVEGRDALILWGEAV